MTKKFYLPLIPCLSLLLVGCGVSPITYKDYQGASPATLQTRSGWGKHLISNAAIVHVAGIDGKEVSSGIFTASRKLLSPGQHSVTISASTPPIYDGEGSVTANFEAGKAYSAHAKLLSNSGSVNFEYQIRDASGKVVAKTENSAIEKKPTIPLYMLLPT